MNAQNEKDVCKMMFQPLHGKIDTHAAAGMSNPLVFIKVLMPPLVCCGKMDETLCDPYPLQGSTILTALQDGVAAIPVELSGHDWPRLAHRVLQHKQASPISQPCIKADMMY